jgi:glucose-6-phosphate 1-dehydrogenase
LIARAKASVTEHGGFDPTARNSTSSIGKHCAGQFRGYRGEPGVKPNSQTETFVAPGLEINSWRWKGVPFFIRAGKNLPVTATDVTVKLRQPRQFFQNSRYQLIICGFA